MSSMNAQSATTAPIITKGDRARITASVLTTVLLHKEGARLTNIAIARLVRSSVHQVATMRKLLVSMGTLGVITDRPLPELPTIPTTTWEEFHSVLFDARDLCSMAEDEGIALESLRSLKALVDVGDALRKTTGTPLATVICITRNLRHATDFAGDEFNENYPASTSGAYGETQQAMPDLRLPLSHVVFTA